MLVYRGNVPEELALDLPTLEGSYAFPIKFGYASVGRVVAAGDRAGEIGVGDLVFVHHPHQDEYVVPAARVVRLPADLPPERGVFLANVETAVNVVLDAHPRLDETVAVFGQGVVGLLVTQLLRRAGARVIAIEPIELRRRLASVCGADAAIRPDQAHALVMGRTSERGADIVIEVSGAAAALQEAIEARPGSHRRHGDRRHSLPSAPALALRVRAAIPADQHPDTSQNCWPPAPRRRRQPSARNARANSPGPTQLPIALMKASTTTATMRMVSRPVAVSMTGRLATPARVAAPGAR